MNIESLSRRFWNKVDKSGDCWLWTGCKNKVGYGKLFTHKAEGKTKLIDAHRASWILHFGSIPEGIYVCHICDNPPCVNPRHLWLGNNSANMLDCIAKGRQPMAIPRTHCPQGHEFTAENTYLRPNRDNPQKPSRVCRICGRAKTKAWEKLHPRKRNRVTQ